MSYAATSRCHAMLAEARRAEPEQKAENQLDLRQMRVERGRLEDDLGEGKDGGAASSHFGC